MHVERSIHQTFGQQRVQAAFDIYNVRPLKVNILFNVLASPIYVLTMAMFYKAADLYEILI